MMDALTLALEERVEQRNADLAYPNGSTHAAGQRALTSMPASDIMHLAPRRTAPSRRLFTRRRTCVKFSPLVYCHLLLLLRRMAALPVNPDGTITFTKTVDGLLGLLRARGVGFISSITTSLTSSFIVDAVIAKEFGAFMSAMASSNWEV